MKHLNSFTSAVLEKRIMELARWGMTCIVVGILIHVIPNVGIHVMTAGACLVAGGGLWSASKLFRKGYPEVLCAIARASLGIGVCMWIIDTIELNTQASSLKIASSITYEIIYNVLLILAMVSYAAYRFVLWKTRRVRNA